MVIEVDAKGLQAERADYEKQIRGIRLNIDALQTSERQILNSILKGSLHDILGYLETFFGKKSIKELTTHGAASGFDRKLIPLIRKFGETLFNILEKEEREIKARVAQINKDRQKLEKDRLGLYKSFRSSYMQDDGNINNLEVEDALQSLERSSLIRAYHVRENIREVNRKLILFIHFINHCNAGKPPLSVRIPGYGWISSQAKLFKQFWNKPIVDVLALCFHDEIEEGKTIIRHLRHISAALAAHAR